MKRLIRKSIDYYDAQERTCAIMYINGEIMEAYSHWDAIKEYFIKNFNINDEKQIDQIIDDVACGRGKYKNFVKGYGMADRIEQTKIIRIIEDSLEGIEYEEFESKLKVQYPEYEIIEDEDWLDRAMNYPNPTLIAKLYNLKKYN